MWCKRVYWSLSVYEPKVSSRCVATSRYANRCGCQGTKSKQVWVHPIKVATVILYVTTMSSSGQRLNFGQVEVWGEYEFAANFQGCVKVCWVGMKLHIVANNAPMLMGIMLFAFLVHSEWLRWSILPPTIVVDAYFVYRIGSCWSSCFYGCRCKY